MQITITGPRGGGSTTLAGLIAKMLRDKGQDVRIRAGGEDEADAIRSIAVGADLELSSRSIITIVTGLEREDEEEVRTRNVVAS